DHDRRNIDLRIRSGTGAGDPDHTIGTTPVVARAEILLEERIDEASPGRVLVSVRLEPVSKKVVGGTLRTRGHGRHNEYSMDQLVVDGMIVVGHRIELFRTHRESGRFGTETNTDRKFRGAHRPRGRLW